ncbi:MAG TPA: hypothetical protein VLA61_00015 [Ideonella sp.]|uniref:hypothetical protein n=1 Tax=Ideonella sp. TaxID=1929293 RepID=UPI002C6F8FE9|nr:hypothetical protein [Ideonella sp.]HSI46634.1 hypothetical protein [Ideonella sp.]
MKLDFRAAPVRRRAVAVVVVVLVHGALVLVLGQSGWQTKQLLTRADESPVVTWMRLLPDPVLRSVRQQAERSVAPAPPSPRSFAVPSPSPSPGAAVEPAPVGLIVPITESRPGSPAAALPGQVGLDGAEVGVPVPVARAASGALVLTPSREVLRESFANPGVLDPRSNTPVPTFEERIAMGMDPGCASRSSACPTARPAARWRAASKCLRRCRPRMASGRRR